MDLETAVKGYFAKREELSRAWNNPALLGDILLKIATYLTHIGDELGGLKEEYEVKRAKTYMMHLNSGKSASNSENLARSENADIKGQVAKLEVMHKNGWSLVSIGQTRIRGLENEARNQH